MSADGLVPGRGRLEHADGSDGQFSVSNVSAMAVTSGHNPVALAACPPEVAWRIWRRTLDKGGQNGDGWLIKWPTWPDPHIAKSTLAR